MTVTLVSSGVQTTSLGTEIVVVQHTAANSYVFVVNSTALANADAVEIAVKVQVNSSPNAGLAYIGAYRHIQTMPVKLSIPIPLAAGHLLQCGIKQTEGTARSFPWELISL